MLLVQCKHILEFNHLSKINKLYNNTPFEFKSTFQFEIRMIEFSWRIFKDFYKKGFCQKSFIHVSVRTLQKGFTFHINNLLLFLLISRLFCSCVSRTSKWFFIFPSEHILLLCRFRKNVILLCLGTETKVYI